VGYSVAMRLHISLDDELVAELDRRVGPRERSAFITAAVRRALIDQRNWEAIETALGAVADHGHDWDDDPAAWVRAQRATDVRRVG
jgi:Arc/MetJ family transcription regulator